MITKLTLITLLFIVGKIAIGQPIVKYTTIGNDSEETLTDMDTLNGFIYAVGTTNECGSQDGFLLKFKDDSLYKKVNIGTWDIENIEAIATTSQDTIVLAGYGNKNTDYDILLIKLDTNLNIIKDQYITLNDWNFCYDLAKGNNFFIGVGTTFEQGNEDALLFKVDNNLDTIWTRTISLPHKQNLNKVIRYNDSIFIASGYTETSNMNKDVFLISFNSNTGDTLWTQRIGGNNDDYGNGLIKTSDGGIAGFGTTSSFTSNNEDTYLFKTDSAGNFLWSNLHQAQSSANIYDDNGIDLIELQNGDLIVSAISRSFGSLNKKSFMLMITTPTGDWLNGFTHDGGEDDYPVAMTKINDTTIYIGGVATSQTFGYNDIAIMKIKTIASSYTLEEKNTELNNLCFVSVEEAKQNQDSHAYPNPTQGELVVTSKKNETAKALFFNTTGQQVFQINITTNTPFSLPSHFTEGVYILHIVKPNETIQEKIIYAK